MKNTLILFSLLAFAGCSTVEISSPGSLEGGDRLLVIQNDGYELLRCIPLWTGNLTWDSQKKCIDRHPLLFANHSDTKRLYAMAKKIAERENCDLVDVTFIDNYIGLNPSNLYGAIQANDTAISAILRPRK